jgi:hypothetical protein
MNSILLKTFFLAPQHWFCTKIKLWQYYAYLMMFFVETEELLECTYTGLEGNLPVEPSLIIFVHALRNGLFRIHMEGKSLR